MKAEILKINIIKNQMKDHEAILRLRNCHGISAQFPSPINNAVITSAKGKTSIIYSKGGPHNGTSSSGSPCNHIWRPEIHIPAKEKRDIKKE